MSQTSLISSYREGKNAETAVRRHNKVPATVKTVIKSQFGKVKTGAHCALTCQVIHLNYSGMKQKNHFHASLTTFLERHNY
jgi:hypothetical protein